MQLILLEIWAYLLIAFLFGMAVQWFFCCRGHKARKGAADRNVAADNEQATAETKAG